MSSEAPKMRGRRRCTGSTDEETEAFFDIWNDMNVKQQLEDLKSNNTTIYKEISKELCDRNYEKKQLISAKPGCTLYADIFALQRPDLDRVEEEERVQVL